MRFHHLSKLCAYAEALYSKVAFKICFLAGCIAGIDLLSYGMAKSEPNLVARRPWAIVCYQCLMVIALEGMYYAG